MALKKTQSCAALPLPARGTSPLHSASASSQVTTDRWQLRTCFASTAAGEHGDAAGACAPYVVLLPCQDRAGGQVVDNLISGAVPEISLAFSVFRSWGHLNPFLPRCRARYRQVGLCGWLVSSGGSLGRGHKFLRCVVGKIARRWQWRLGYCQE